MFIGNTIFTDIFKEVNPSAVSFEQVRFYRFIHFSQKSAL